jgi:hypothetical protein
MNETFSEALEKIKKGVKMRRACWKSFLYIDLMTSYEDGLPYINTNQPNSGIYWKPDQGDLLANDWELYG